MDTNTLGLWAKKKLIDLAKEADSRLEKYWNEEMESGFGFNETQKELVRKILLHAKEHNLRSAKRVRASFVYFGYRLGGGVVDDLVWKAAEGVELVHTALLMHDDFMDRDLVRRGRPTTQVFFGQDDDHYGEAMAVNCGDAVLCLGFERLLRSGANGEVIKRAMGQMLRSITNTAFGQAYDVSLPKLGELTEEKVVNLHKAKTAIYTFENPLLIGGTMAGLPEEVLDILRKYSVDGGVAFQLQDDILGVYGKEEKTGKSANSDLLQGKVTLLVVKTLEMGTEKQRQSLMRVWGKQEADKQAISEAKEAILDSGAYQYSLDVAKNYAEKATETTAGLRGRGLNSEAIDFLEGIARYMVEREM